MSGRHRPLGDDREAAQARFEDELARLANEPDPALASPCEARLSPSLSDALLAAAAEGPPAAAAPADYESQDGQTMQERFAAAKRELEVLRTKIRAGVHRSDDLRQLRREFARNHHPDLLGPDRYSDAEQIMQAANVLIDEALRQSRSN